MLLRPKLHQGGRGSEWVSRVKKKLTKTAKTRQREQLILTSNYIKYADGSLFCAIPECDGIAVSSPWKAYYLEERKNYINKHLS